MREQLEALIAKWNDGYGWDTSARGAFSQAADELEAALSPLPAEGQAEAALHTYCTMGCAVHPKCPIHLLENGKPKQTADYYESVPTTDSPLRPAYTLAMAQLTESRDQWKARAEELQRAGVEGQAEARAMLNCVGDQHVFTSPQSKGRCACRRWLIAVAEGSGEP